MYSLYYVFECVVLAMWYSEWGLRSCQGFQVDSLLAMRINAHTHYSWLFCRGIFKINRPVRLSINRRYTWSSALGFGLNTLVLTQTSAASTQWQSVPCSGSHRYKNKGRGNTQSDQWDHYLMLSQFTQNLPSRTLKLSPINYCTPNIRVLECITCSRIILLSHQFST